GRNLGAAADQPGGELSGGAGDDRGSMSPSMGRMAIQPSGRPFSSWICQIFHSTRRPTPDLASTGISTTTGRRSAPPTSNCTGATPTSSPATPALQRSGRAASIWAVSTWWSAALFVDAGRAYTQWGKLERAYLTTEVTPWPLGFHPS